MPTTVRLKDIVEALGMQFGESSAFLDLDSGQGEAVSHTLLRAEDSGDEEPDLPTWQKHEWEIAKRKRSPSDKEARSLTRPKIFSMCYFSDIAQSGINRAAPKLTLNRLHHTETARYFDKSTSGPSI
jgi:hypothetical protein